VSTKLAELRKKVGDTPLTGAVSMAYLDEGGALQCVSIPVAGDGPTEDEWVKLREKAEAESSSVYEVLSMDEGGFTTPSGPATAGRPDEMVMLEALTLAECGRVYRCSAR